MQLIRDWQASPEPVTAVAIGNFDGVHLGHQALLSKCRELAGKQRSGAISFAPLPVEVLSPDFSPGRITSTRQRIQELREQQLDLLWLLRFNQLLAQQTPQAFIQRVLVEGLAVKHVVVGNDFRFGHLRAGDISLLKSLGEVHGFEVHPHDTVINAGQRISSSRIRQALKMGDISTASGLLGRPYEICGRVVRGQQLGRQLGFPTINIDVSRWRCLLTGVFAVQIEPERLELRSKTTHNHPFAERPWSGVASIGYRPSVIDTVNHNRHLLEVHVFDWSGDVYGQRVRVRFIQRLRDEQQFSDLSVMTEQMHSDANQARAILHNIIE